MDKTVKGMIGAVTALAASAGVVSAAPADFGGAMRSESYADLLRPIPNARALLSAREAATDGAVQGEGAFGEAHVIPAQIVIGVPFRHHHHHRYWRRRYWHHHHHHWRHHHHY